MLIPLEETEAFVREKFEGKLDRLGVPLADHAARVVGYLEGYDEVTLTAGWLHDIVEDTDTTLDELLEIYPSEVVEVVELLTHDKKVMTYAEYIDRICESGNIHAIRVKLADQKDNKDPNRFLKLDKWVRRALTKRYIGVEQKLLEAAINV